MKYRHVYLLVINNVWTLLNIYIVGSNSVEVWQGEIVCTPWLLTQQAERLILGCVSGWLASLRVCSNKWTTPEPSAGWHATTQPVVNQHSLRCFSPPHYFLII